MCKLELNVSELIYADKLFVTLPEMQDVPIILGRTWQRKYNCFLDWNCRLAHCQSAHNQLWVSLQESDKSYTSEVMSILSRSSTWRKLPNKRLPAIQIRQSATHIWQKMTNNSTTTKEPIKATQQRKLEVWKWIPKQKHEEASNQKIKWIPKTSTTSQNQSPKKPR